ncbi:MAG: tRNA lysidine(34) synthetase TilS [Planctomycetota bacterium]
MAQLTNRLLQMLRRHRMFRDAGNVVVGFSGGPDSTALVRLLLELIRSGKLDLELHLAHLNHGLREEEAEADEAFCREFAAARGLSIHVERADVAAAAEQEGASMEAQARRTRYAFLGRVAEQEDAAAVATAHHADDVAETVLLRLLRGAAVEGLGAMPAVRKLSRAHPDVRLVRPLLEIRKDELLRYLAETGQDYRRDRSNLDTAIDRNRVRHELIPRLEREFPTFSPASLRGLNESALEISRLLEELADRAWPQVCRRTEAGGVVLDAEALAELQPAVRKRTMQRAVRELSPRATRSLRVEQLRRLAALPTAEPGAELDLPGVVLARREHEVIYLSTEAEDGALPPRRLAVPGHVDLPEAGLRVLCDELPAGAVGPERAKHRAGPRRVFVRAEGLEGPLTVRGRRAGDRFHPLGGPGGKRLKGFFIDRKVPRHERDRIPLVTAPDGRIVWVVGMRLDERFKLRNADQRALRLQAEEIASEVTDRSG